MSSRVTTSILLAALLFAVALLVPRITAVRLPGTQQGYEPTQPIAYSHRLHAGELQVNCQYCHFGSETSRHAGIPPANVCMNCHRFVAAPLGALRAEEAQAKQEKRQVRRVVSPELQKLYDALALKADMTPDPAMKPKPIEWVRVNRLPDFAYFNHGAHVNAGVACQQCHGPIETMERVRQVPDLSMGWCVNCHRQATASGVNGRKVNASTDCSTCHY